MADFTGKLLHNYKQLKCKFFKNTFQKRKQSFIKAFSISMTVPLRKMNYKQRNLDDKRSARH